MQVNVEPTPFEEVKVIHQEVFKDSRGFFTEVFREDQYSELGLPSKIVQFNHSGSIKNTVRGLHFQWDPPLGKFMRVIRGQAFLTAVDIRKGSPNLGKSYSRICDADDNVLIWAPAGFARGFAVLSDYAEIQYLFTGLYNPKAESGLIYNDPALDIDWPVINPILSARDINAQTLKEWLGRPESDNFQYGGNE